MKNRCKNWIGKLLTFGSDFSSIFHGFWTPFYVKKQQKRWRVVRFSCFRHFVFKTDLERFGGRFGIDFSAILGPKTSLKRIRKQIKKIIKFRIDFSSLFDRFGLPSWVQVGSPNRLFRLTRGSKRTQKGVSNRVPKKASKMNPK